MCDICSDVIELLQYYENDIKRNELRCLYRQEINTLCSYVQSWVQRQCTCCFKDHKNFDRFNALVQGFTLSIIELLNQISRDVGSTSDRGLHDREDSKGEDWSSWPIEDKEKILNIYAKVFLLNFPLYMAFKHSMQSKIDELDIPVYLLRNVCFFCEKGGLKLFISCFQDATPETLPMSLANAMITVISNLKLWMNIGIIMQHLVPLRSSVIRYLCLVNDSHLRAIGTRNIFEFMWTAVKDPLDAHATFDKEGLDLAFKYFNSSTLTMRLAGISQINSHINMYNELCHNESLVDAENVGNDLANWLINNKIIECIFGPNMHVELIKQSHTILNFLAMEGRITKHHIDAVWCAAQLKHCSRQVLDLLPPLIKNLEVTPVLHLYKHLCSMEIKEHTNQTLLLASALIKFIWSSGSSPSSSNEIFEGSDQSPFSLFIKGAEKQDGSSSSDVSEDEKRFVPTEMDSFQAGGSEHVDESPPSSPCEHYIGRKRGSPCQHPTGHKWRHTYAGRVRPSVFSANSKVEFVENSSSGEESELSSVTDDSLHSDCLEETNAELPSKELLVERLWKKRTNKEDLRHCFKKRCFEIKEELSEESVENYNRNVSPLRCTSLKEAEDVLQKLNVDKCGDLVKVVLDRSGNFSSLEEDSNHVPIPHNSVEDILSPDDGSSHISNKSVKNLADFEEDESGCEEIHPTYKHHSLDRDHFVLDSVCEPGQTLLWDLLQDDKIIELGEGVANEAEKILCTLVCWSTEKMIRMKFIEGCLKNIASNKSVMISMRLLPKLFSSFQQFRENSDTHSVTMWAEKEHKMMKHFFSNLVYYTSNRSRVKSSTLYTHKDEIQVRLHFLTCIFSAAGSPQSFRLSHDQVDTLWQCLAHDEVCADELFGWLLNQAKSKDQHALNISSFKHVLLEKMPQLPAKTTSMMALNLLQQLSSIAHLASASYDTPSSAADVNGMRQLWDIALRALNTDVSMAAIHYLNNYYINIHHGSLEKEEEFIEQCMESLLNASQKTQEAEDINLMIIQRALLLLKTHLEVFRRRYAYHLRRWQLNGQLHGVGCHSSSHATVVRIICQPAGLSEKTTFELHNCDTIADLRAEVTQWWEHLQRKQTDTECCSILGTMLSDGPIRMISQGQELTSDLDEKTLDEIGIKDQQLVFVSVGVPRQSCRREGLEPASALSPPPREKLPLLLLLKKPYFEQLFNLMQVLGSFKSMSEEPKAQILSRKVWEILMMLPTSPSMLKNFKNISEQSDLKTIIDSQSPQKLMYSLQIVETLRQKKDLDETANVSDNTIPWSTKFLQCGGLNHLFDIFLSGSLQPKSETDWNEWNQDCVVCLLRLMFLFGIEEEPIQGETQKKRKGKWIIPKLNEIMLDVMRNAKLTLSAIFSLMSAATSSVPHKYKTGFWGRDQVVSCAMTLLVSWAFSEPQVKDFLFESPVLMSLLKRLVLDDPEPSLRREACTGFYRLCLGTSVDGESSGCQFVVPLLNCLLKFLSDAHNMQPHQNNEEEKEGCKDYFWLVCCLVESLKEETKDNDLDLGTLAQHLSECICSRDHLEMRNTEDEGLRGLINLMSVVMRRNQTFKFSKEGKELVLKLFDGLFALPNRKHRHLPKFKSIALRSASYDLLVEMLKGSFDNYILLHEKLLNQNSPGSHSSNPYPWDYWPQEDGRAEYVGLTNLGATCYLASCIQHLYMIPEARLQILSAKIDEKCKHSEILHELQRMFAYLLESERKAYSPRNFCKVYTMDHQLLNTGEQTDMAEFFTNLISKLEEMTPELKQLMKTLFCGVTSNNVVSLDCPHISRTLEEFYTLRCQVADMKNLFDSIDEITVKDTLEGDNMYTCSQCGKKVRAEKRACLKKLPKILCFNMMRYTFSFVTNSKEKVNTHFSFPMHLDMANYMEKNLIPKQHITDNDQQHQSEDECYEYELIGVTVHTGNAEGGHYYSFIKERDTDKWFLFNDSEVKIFDPSHIPAECFGGETTSKTYDSVTDKFMDFSFEKTNSAYMLFYERITTVEEKLSTIELSSELADWIWQDNMQFLQDKSLFEHNYFNFMWQVCSHIPDTISSSDLEGENIALLSTKLAVSFVLETLIHAKEKPTVSQWIELLTKQFNASHPACEWFLEHMTENSWWPVQILIKCPNQVVRQLFQRLCVHVIGQLKPAHSALYLRQPSCDSDDSSDADTALLGQYSCVTRFVRKLLTLIGAKQQYLKYLTEFFGFLHEFAKMGEDECHFLLSIETISTIVNFYLGEKSADYVEVLSEEEEEEDVIPLDEKYKQPSLEKMVSLVALLVEKSRNEEKLQLSHNDFNAVAGGKGFPFLYQQIRDGINLRQTCNLIFSLCRWNDALAVMIVNMIFTAITKQHETSGSFFKLLSLLVECVGVSPGVPPFTNLILQRIWEVADYCPQQCMEWLTIQVPRNKVAHSWVLQSMDSWVEQFLIAHNVQRVRNVVALLLISLVPSNSFRQAYRAARSILMPHKEVVLNTEALGILHKIYELLLRLLKRLKMYVDPVVHGTTKLTSYFAVMTYCLLSKKEKLMFSPYFLDLWNLFQPKLSEPAIPVHMNKQALLLFWYHVCTDCPENVELIIQNPHVTKNIAFNYILADHEEQEVIVFNRCMLPAYYGLLRLCCQHSPSFTRQLASHQNIQWAFKNITPYTTQYNAAISELFKLMRLFVTKYSDTTEQEVREIQLFKRTTLRLYLSVLDARACWATLINVLRILVETADDRIFVICNNGLPLLFQAFNTLHMMYHEATACHVTTDMLDLLRIVLQLLKSAYSNRGSLEMRLADWKDQPEVLRKLLTLLNSFTPPELRQISIEVLHEMVLLYPSEGLSTLIPLLHTCHLAFQENNSAAAGTTGPFFPRRGQKLLSSKTSVRPPRPIVQMFLHSSLLEAPKGVDEDYDNQLLEFFQPYHELVDMLCRVAISNDVITPEVVNLSAMLAIEGIPMHLTLFPKLWLDSLHSDEFMEILTSSSHFVEYIESVLLDERTCLNDPITFQAFNLFLPKVSNQVVNEQLLNLVSSLMVSFIKSYDDSDLEKQASKLNGDLRTLCLIFSVELPQEVPKEFVKNVNRLIEHCVTISKEEEDCKNKDPTTSGVKQEDEAEKNKLSPQIIQQSAKNLVLLLQQGDS